MSDTLSMQGRWWRLEMLVEEEEGRGLKDWSWVRRIMLGMAAVAVVVIVVVMVGVGSNGGGTVGMGVMVVVVEAEGHDGRTRMRDLNVRKVITLA